MDIASRLRDAHIQRLAGFGVATAAKELPRHLKVVVAGGRDLWVAQL